MKVYELLATPDKWIQDWFAKDKDGNFRSEDDPLATCYCLIGAILKCYRGPQQGKAIALVKTKLPPKWQCGEEFMGGISGWNDDPKRTHAEVLELCKELDI